MKVLMFHLLFMQSCRHYINTAICILLLQQTKCIFDGNCKIDANTRRFCPHCRLKKCFDVGMNKDLILGRNFSSSSI